MNFAEGILIAVGTGGVGAGYFWWAKHINATRVRRAEREAHIKAFDGRRLRYWRNRAANAKAALELELRMKRGRIGPARKAYEDATAQVLRLEKDDPATKLAMQTAAVTTDPSEPS